MRRSIIIVAAAAVALPGCGTGLGGGGFGYGGYSLIRARSVEVGDGSVVVTPTREWNRVSSMRGVRALQRCRGRQRRHNIPTLPRA